MNNQQKLLNDQTDYLPPNQYKDATENIPSGYKDFNSEAQANKLKTLDEAVSETIVSISILYY